MTDDDPSFTRREVIATGTTLAALPAFGPAASARPASKPTSLPVEMRVNGAVHRFAIDPRSTLLDTLRERMALFGTKKGCDLGQCGACTVHVDGRRILSCLTLTLQAAGREVTTIEGIEGVDGKLHPMQQAFLDHDALQCGYCTPGQIMSGIACVAEGHARTEDDVREYMSGNLCRCGAYRGIVAAIRQVAERSA